MATPDFQIPFSKFHTNLSEKCRPLRLPKALDVPVWPQLALGIAVHRVSVRGNFSHVLCIYFLGTREAPSTAAVRRIWSSAVLGAGAGAECTLLSFLAPG